MAPNINDSWIMMVFKGVPAGISYLAYMLFWISFFTRWFDRKLPNYWNVIGTIFTEFECVSKRSKWLTSPKLMQLSQNTKLFLDIYGGVELEHVCITAQNRFGILTTTYNHNFLAQRQRKWEARWQIVKGDLCSSANQTNLTLMDLI